MVCAFIVMMQQPHGRFREKQSTRSELRLQPHRQTCLAAGCIFEEEAAAKYGKIIPLFEMRNGPVPHLMEQWRLASLARWNTPSFYPALTQFLSLQPVWKVQSIKDDAMFQVVSVKDEGDRVLIAENQPDADEKVSADGL